MEVTIHSTVGDQPERLTIPTDPDDRVDSLIIAFCTQQGIQMSNEYVLSSAGHEELHGTRKIGTVGIKNGDTLYLNRKGSGVGFKMECSTWWLLAAVMLLLGGVGLVAVSIVKVRGDIQPKRYGLVFDAGSSHTMLFLYSWPGNKENGTGVIKQGWTCRADGGGISSYASNPTAAGASIRPCLSQSLDRVPAEKRKATPVVLGATAGMRLLNKANKAASDAVMSSIRSVLNSTSYNFTFPQQQARIISGLEEGAFSWVTTNFLDQRFGPSSATRWHPSPKTVSSTLGALDMGGASTQITFEPGPGTDMPANYSETLLLYGSTYHVYTNSYLCYGLNEAIRRYKALLVIDQNVTSASMNHTVLDPCAPSGNVTALPYSEVFEVPCSVGPEAEQAWGYMLQPPPHLQQNDTFSFVGTSDPAQCRQEVQKLFSFNQTCPYSRCSFSGHYQPEIHGEFRAFSGFYYTVDFFNLTKQDKFPLGDFEGVVRRYCNMSWLQVSGIPGSQDYLVKYCFDGTYLLTLLTRGYGFNETNWHQLQFVKQISGADVGWSMGFMINTTNIIPALYPSNELPLLTFSLLTVLFTIFIFIAIAFGCHARTEGRKGKAQYKRMTDYGTIE